MCLLRLRERDGDLGESILEVDLERYDGQAFLRRRAEQLADFALMKEELAGAGGRRVVLAAGPVMRNRHALEPDFAIAHMSIRFTQARLAITQRLDLGPAENETRLPRFQEMVIVPGFRVP